MANYDLNPVAPAAAAPPRDELLFSQSALLLRTTHIAKRYSIKHADPGVHRQLSAALSAHMTSLLARLATTARHRADSARKLPDMEPGRALWPSIGAIRDLEKQQVERWAAPPPYLRNPYSLQQHPGCFIIWLK